VKTKDPWIGWQRCFCVVLFLKMPPWRSHIVRLSVVWEAEVLLGLPSSAKRSLRVPSPVCELCWSIPGGGWPRVAYATVVLSHRLRWLSVRPC
jgi:hypothetical protein